MKESAHVSGRRAAETVRAKESGTPRPAPSSSPREEAATPPTEGDRAPAFELPAHAGGTLSSKQLAGTSYVLYFYPKDDTPGCTTEACEFRDAHADFVSAGVRVIGVSPDTVARHQKFSAKYELPFDLLSDPDHRLAEAYGVWALKKNYGKEYMGIIRSTFFVDARGVIRNVWRGVRVKGHIDQVKAVAAEKATRG